MSLAEYKKKRNFKKTPEPGAKKSGSNKTLSFVIQRHIASRLHYDFRLEMDGVLKSWAVPKGPSLNPKDKRLAMMVEDHPYSYKDFSGVIPEGNYGAGIVEVWDKGQLTDMEESDAKTAEKNLKAGLKRGDLKFRLKGKKVKGEFALVKMKGRGENNWLLIKHKDKYAVEEYDSENFTAKNSPINKWLSKNGKNSEASVKKTAPKKTAPKKAVPKKTTKKIKSDTEKTKVKKSAEKKTDPAKKVTVKKDGKAEKERYYTFGRTKVRTTNPNKIYWPEEGITKSEMIDYYVSISKYLLPYLKDRPQSLKRNPNGIRDFGFFHKDAGDTAPEFVKSEPLYSESVNKTIDYIICNNAATLTYMNNLGCIEINPWHSTLKDLDKPDYLIIDIDPSDDNTFDQVIETANVVKDVFLRAGVTSYCKTSGASGLHVYVPTQKKYSYEQVKDFAHLICLLVEEELPGFTTLERSLKKRGSKHIYLDYLQNRRGQTISSVYSLRPKKGATVSIPLKWSEVKPGLTPQDFTIYNALKRIEKTGDIFSGVLGKGINLEKCLKLLNK